MKKSLLILSLALFGSSLSFGQTTIEEQYFHELRGMEDSSGTTHLFYRHYQFIKKIITSCGEQTLTFYSTYNDVYQLSPSLSIDSLKFRSYYGESCIGNENRSIKNYLFYNNNPEKWIVNLSTLYVFTINDYLDNVIDFQTQIVIKRNEAGIPSIIPEDILLSPNNDSLYVKNFSDNVLPFPGNGNEWPIFGDYNVVMEYADSLAIEWNIIEIHPLIDSLYFAVKSGDLYRSSRYSSDFTFADSSTFFRNLFFDPDTSHIYTLTSSGLLRSDDLGKEGTWQFREIDFNAGSTKFLAVDKSASGNLFISDSANVLFSDNYGDTFTSFIAVNHEITGLYKKPNSNLLYVLTRKELLEINTETKSVTSLKHISVNNEPEPKDIPKQVTLSQNYPNPFNPSTVISYQLAENSLVRLEVFDVTGRKVAVLVEGERKAAGTHQVSFKAENLASGVYFYRLETAGQTLTQKMLLVK